MLLALAGVSSAAMAQQKPVVVEQVDIIHQSYDEHLCRQMVYSGSRIAFAV